MKKILALFSKYEIWLLALLKPLGFWGVGALAVLDSAAIPVPLDLIVAGYIWSNKAHFYVYVLVAAVGSAVGCLVPFFLGRAGGEIFLMKRIDRRRYQKLRDRFERQEFLAVAIPAILPPPAPLKIFVFGAGVFEMRLVNFMLAVFTGRAVRYLIIAAVTIRYGLQIIQTAEDLATKHGRVVMTVLLVLIGGLIFWVVRKRRASRRAGPPEV